MEEILIGSGLSSRVSDEVESDKGSDNFNSAEEAKLVRKRIVATTSFNDNKTSIYKFSKHHVNTFYKDYLLINYFLDNYA